MKKIILALAGILLLTGHTVRSQDLSPEEILSKYYQSAGLAGEKDWKTVLMSGRNIGEDTDHPYRVYLKRPGLARTEFELQGIKMIQVWDGKQGWSIAPWQGSLDPQDMTPDESKDLKNLSDFEGALYRWKEKGYTVKLIGREEVEGTPAFNIELKKPGGDKENYYLDAEHFMIIKIAFHQMVMGHPSESERYFADYRQVEGVFLPFIITDKGVGQNNHWSSQTVFDRILVNQDVSDSLFMKPVKK